MGLSVFAMKEVGNYDLVVKDLFERDHPSLLDQLTGGVAVRQILNSELAVTLARRADLVFLLEDESVLHLEFQSRNDKQMPYRHLPRTGEDAYGRSFGSRRNKSRLAILKKAANVKGSNRQTVLSQLVQLSGLRQLQDDLITELNLMLSPSDPFLKIPLVQDMVRTASLSAARDADRDARVQVLRDLLKGEIPRSARLGRREASRGHIGSGPTLVEKNPHRRNTRGRAR